MMRSVLLVTALALSLFTCTLQPPADPAPGEGLRYLFVRPEMVQFFQTRHALQGKMETALCLLGYRDGPVVVVQGVDQARVEDADSVSGSFYPCTSERLIGIYHNHPTGLCMLSDIDRETMMNDERYLVWIVSCNDGVVAEVRGQTSIVVLRSS